MCPIDGVIKAIGVSGRHWIGYNERRAFDVIADTLNSAQDNIRIATYSFGKKSPELERIFDILDEKSSSGIRVQIVANKIEKASSFAKIRLKKLSKSKYVTIHNFRPENDKEDLHAKIISVDGSEIVIGSANISKSGMFSNHEVIVKISGGEFATRINVLLNELVRSIVKGG